MGDLDFFERQNSTAWSVRVTNRTKDAKTGVVSGESTDTAGEAIRAMLHALAQPDSA